MMIEKSSVEKVSAMIHYGMSEAHFGLPLPPRDNAAYLQALRHSFSAEHHVMNEHLVQQLSQLLRNNFMDPTRQTVRFTPGYTEPFDAVQPLILATDKNPRSWIEDPEKLFGLIRQNPERVSTNCLNAIPLSILTIMTEQLIARGYDGQSVYSIFKNILLFGELTGMFLQNQIVAPFSIPLDSDVQKGSAPPTFSHVVSAYQIQTGHQQNPADLAQRVFFNNIQEGDIFYAWNKGLQHLPTHGNPDDQNGIILRSHPDCVSADAIDVFAHHPKVADRTSSLGNELVLLRHQCLKHDISHDEYYKRGGLRILVSQFNYAGFYAALATYLQGV